MAGERRTRGAFDSFLVWNRRVHYYLGLYLLFFIWLFAFTGLLLNHPRWQFAQFWPNRIQSTTEHTIAAVTAVTDIDRARDVMRQLGVAGEVPVAGDTARERTVHVPGQPTWVGRRREGRPASGTRDSAKNATERVGRDARPSHVHGCSRCRLAEPARLDADDRLGAVDGCRRGRADRDGPRQLRHVVPVEGQASRRNRRPGARLHQLWSVHRGVAVAALRSRQTFGPQCQDVHAPKHCPLRMW